MNALYIPNKNKISENEKHPDVVLGALKITLSFRAYHHARPSVLYNS